MLRSRLEHPIAITMWDFSWLERRWPGAGYEDWDVALDELKERGYDAVRIDAYPHLVAADPERTWELVPVWNQQIWGSPALNRVAVQPALNGFIEKCAERDMLVGLSTWFREDREDDTRMGIRSPEDLGYVWRRTLDSIAGAGLLESILYVDLCNEWPLPIWTPFLKVALGGETEDTDDTGIDLGPSRTLPEVRNWMEGSIAAVREAYPDLDYCFSVCSEYDTWEEQDVSFMDLLEPHIWMVQWGDFYERVGYNFERFDPAGYDNLVQKGEALYREDPDHWKARLDEGIELAAEWSRRSGKPLITTECWSVVDYKDWPLLSWDWVKELCEFGVREGVLDATLGSYRHEQLCGPQFVGMWRDVGWHRRMTDLVHHGSLE